mmetsp:Transcript_100749/g.139989  ORF Transcript_100749/g.139989 Transcript_100749/m.139989 type:complete len:149 (-) Transcript_100749:447-893(-)|eukprot:symbB.v1.2.013914.t1/scaffold987.1/size146359/4
MLLSGPCAPLQATMMGMQSAPVKPEKGLADDLPELFFSPYGDKKDVMLAILSQNSKLDPRSSFYTVDAPEGLPRNQGAAPNRLMHEYGRERMLRFMNEVHVRPQKLSNEVKLKRSGSLQTDRRVGIDARIRQKLRRLPSLPAFSRFAS